MRKISVFLVFTLFFVCVYAETVDIDIPEVSLSVQNGFVIPKIEGFELDGIGEEVVLPFKRITFGSEVVKVEIIKQHKIVLPAPLKKGAPLFRMNDMRRVDKTAFGARRIPSVAEFTFGRFSTFKRTQQLFGFDFYPIIPVGEKEIIKIDKIRVSTKGRILLPMTNTKSGRSLLILTTEYFMSESEEIWNYISAKRKTGFTVNIATETSYDGGKLEGVERAEKIREYLKGVYKNYDFLLIIAGTEPGGSEVPMIVTKPCRTDEPSYDSVPTDIFYAELTEDIDGNKNGTYGEFSDNINYAFELIVGRIPIYGKNVRDADKILARTVDFIKEKPSTAEYRRRILFPTTISYYARQDNQRGIPKMDGAYVAEYLQNNSIKEPFSSKTLVEKSGIDPSEFIDEEALTYQSMQENMDIGYGTVFWQAHGLEDCSARTIWGQDSNENGIPETYKNEISSDIFVNSALMYKVKTLSPFVFQGSCLNGSIQFEGSLAYDTLKNTAVGVVGASQVSYGTIFSDYDLSSQDIFSYGAVFTDAVIKNDIPAKTFFETKEKWLDYSVLLTIKHETNYLGDPSLTLNVRECSSDADCDDAFFCNGVEKCVDGFCETDADSVPCLGDTAECETKICDESTKSCKISKMPDGSFCGVSKNACIGGRQCQNSKCVDVNLTDCSHLDSECAKGSCDTETGDCVMIPENEGQACSSGKICIQNEVCAQGFCVGEDPDLPEAKECNKTECSEYGGGFLEVADVSQNWNPCTTSDGKTGYCDYGTCIPKKRQNEKSSSSGCSVTVF